MTDNDTQVLSSVKDKVLEKNFANLKGTSITIPTYELSLKNPNGNELRVAPGPKGRDTILIGAMDNSDGSFNVIREISEPNWIRFSGRSACRLVDSRI